jgi:molecular chaperone GrpE
MTPKNPTPPSGDDEQGGAGGNSGAPGSGDEFIQAEGPDVETSLTDADEAFLAGIANGTAAPGANPDSEHLADLKRVTAEYANYRRRVERERIVERERAIGEAARVILPVLDDLDRAEQHGDLAEGGPLTTIAQKLRGQVTKLGLIPFGEKGDAFDPHQHDAIFQRESPDVTKDTVADVVERGYRIGDTVLRVAKVVVDTPSGR